MVETVKGRADVQANARKTGKTVHFANMLELSAKLKGRVADQGDSAKGESGVAAVFADAASSSSLAEAS
eukprot:6706701-Pyramimonas_sp.AAC.1